MLNGYCWSFEILLSVSVNTYYNRTCIISAINNIFAGGCFINLQLETSFVLLVKT